MPIRTLFVAALVLALAPSATLAQADFLTIPAPLCFRGRKAALCRAFLLTEASLITRERGASRGVDLHLQWDLGAMVNVGESGAVGGTVHFGEPDDGRWGGAARYRRWLENGLAVDLSPGFVVVRNHNGGRRLRPTANVSISAGDWVGAFAHGESLRDGVQAGVGFKLGSWLGTIAGGALYGLLSALPGT